MRSLTKISNFVDKIAGYFVAIIFSLMIFACVMQVYTRFILNDSLSWTEELARYTFIWSTMLAASICVKRSSHATVTLLLDFSPPFLKRFLSMIIHIIICYVAVIMTIYGTQMMIGTSEQLSPSLRMSMGILYLSLPVSGICILIHSFDKMLPLLFAKNPFGEKM